MTENQWLSSTDPQAMHAFICDRVTERQMRFFVEACREALGVPGNMAEADAGRFAEWCNFRELLPAELRADILREIIGNPFRPIVRREGEFWRSNVAIPQWLWEEKPPNSIEFDPAWLTWNNATIPNLIRAMMEEECDNENRWTVPVPSYTVASGNQLELHLCDEYCPQCKGTNVIPRDEPQWAMLPILGDVLEEAGCAEAAILDHLRGTEPCPHCDGEGARFYDEDDRLQCKQRCDDCNGTGNRPVRHVVGCWCVELLKGGIQ